MGKTTTMGVKLDEETRDRLKALANARQRSAHWLMKDAINKYLEREEEIERRNREADEAWEEYQRTGQFVGHDAMESWLDTWGTDKEDPCPELKS
ncbi:MAG: CopG family ribbon-helix-helix protein [Thermodesulfobacteriota bacterium]|jgi:predicted transcriptional regulator